MRPIFSATLSPNAALSARGRSIVLVVVGILAAIPGLVFFMMGAWPVLGLMGLDVLALWWALRVSSRAAGAREEITLWPDAVEIVSIDAGGGRSVERLNPLFTRLEVERDAAARVSRLLLLAPDRRREIARVLSAEEKAGFASHFGPALARVRTR